MKNLFRDSDMEMEMEMEMGMAVNRSEASSCSRGSFIWTSVGCIRYLRINTHRESNVGQAENFACGKDFHRRSCLCDELLPIINVK